MSWRRVHCDSSFIFSFRFRRERWQRGARSGLAELRRFRRNLLSGGNVALRCVLAQLQRADVGDDVPAILCGNLRRIVGHDPEAVRHNVEDVSDGRLLQTHDVERGRLAGKSPRRNKAVPIAYARMTRSAVDVEAFLPALKNFFGYGKRHHVTGIAADFAGVKVIVFVQLSAGDGAFDMADARSADL